MDNPESIDTWYGCRRYKGLKTIGDQMNNQHEGYHYKREIQRMSPGEVIVVGGGISGVFAALASSKIGVDTTLIEQHGFVGGQATAGGVHTFCGETRFVNNDWDDMVKILQRFSAISEYRPNYDGRKFDTEILKYVLQLKLQKAGVRLLLHTKLVDIERIENNISSIILFNKSGLQQLQCKQVIDASGDADVIAMGNWPYEKGGPVFFPGDKPHILSEIGDLQLPMSLYFTLVKAEHEVIPVLPEGLQTYGSDEDLPMLSVYKYDNLVIVKMKVIGYDATVGDSLSSAELKAREQMMAVIYHLQTKGYKGHSYHNFKLAWVAPHIGVREGRRIIAQHRLSTDDILRGRHFEDAVAVGSYHVDYHWPTVVQRAGTGLTTQIPPYQIPLRAMRPIGVENLLVPGRSMSGEQMAMSSFRVMGTCAQTGFAAGTAAALAITRQQKLDDMPIRVIKEQLRSSGVRLDLSPYTNYLRGRRSIQEHVFKPTDLFNECHASTVALLPNGDIVCAWFGGTTEGADDVCIWLAIRHEEAWSKPIKVVEANGTPTWNPVLFVPDTSRLFCENSRNKENDNQPRMLLYYRVGKKITEWSPYFIESLDGGHNWSSPVKLPTGLMGPTKNKPIVLEDGTWLAGASVETDTEWYCQIESSEDEGRQWKINQVIKLDSNPMGIIQPTLWESKPGHIHALMRSRGTGKICRSDSEDGGSTWSPAYKTDLPNNNSGIDLAKLVPSPGDPGYGSKTEDSPIVLAFNPVTEGRTPLVLATSYDNGKTWPNRLTLQNSPGEYSYPSIIPTADGVAITYTDNRKCIYFERYSLEHLQGKRNIDIVPGLGDHQEHPGWIELLTQKVDP